MKNEKQKILTKSSIVIKESSENVKKQLIQTRSGVAIQVQFRSSFNGLMDSNSAILRVLGVVQLLRFQFTSLEQSLNIAGEKVRNCAVNNRNDLFQTTADSFAHHRQRLVAKGIFDQIFIPTFIVDTTVFDHTKFGGVALLGAAFCSDQGQNSVTDVGLEKSALGKKQMIMWHWHCRSDNFWECDAKLGRHALIDTFVKVVNDILSNAGHEVQGSGVNDSQENLNNMLYVLLKS